MNYLWLFAEVRCLSDEHVDNETINYQASKDSSFIATLLVVHVTNASDYRIITHGQNSSNRHTHPFLRPPSLNPCSTLSQPLLPFTTAACAIFVENVQVRVVLSSSPIAMIASRR